MKVPQLILGDFIFKFHEDKCLHHYSMSLRIVSSRITVESVLTPVLYKSHTEIYRSNVNKRPIWYKTCDDTVAITYMFS